MMNNVRFSRFATLCFLLMLAVVLLSWIFDVYGLSVVHPQTGEEISVQSLLAPEGIRWWVRHVVSNFTDFALLGWGIVLVFGWGVAQHSGFFEAYIRWGGWRPSAGKQLSRKERRALVGALLAGGCYVALVLFATFSPWSILRSVTGGLARSPFLEGLPFLLSFGFGLLGMVYGFASGRYRTDSDVISGMAHPLKYLGICFVIAFFLAQLLACLDYSRLDSFFLALIL